MRICLKQIRYAAIGFAALGMLVPSTTEAGALRDAVGGAMSAASRGGSSMGRALSTVRSSGSYQRLKSSVSGAGRSALSGTSGLTTKARQAVTNSGTLQRMKQSFPTSSTARQALGQVNQQFTQRLGQSMSAARPAMAGAFGNVQQSATSAFSKAKMNGLGAVQQSMRRALDVNRSVFQQFQQKLPGTMATLAAANGNPGIAGIAAQGQPLDSLSNLATALKAKAGIQGPILPPAVTDRLKQSEVLRAAVTHPQLSNAKTQFINRLQASGVDVTKLKADLNMALNPALMAANGNPGIAGIAAQGQPLDSLSNLATALKAKAGIQGPILPPAVANQLKQSEVLKAIVTDPRLSNAKTQLVNRLQAAGVDVNQLKADLNKALDPNQPAGANMPNGLAQLLEDVGVIPKPPGDIDVVGQPPIVEDGGIVPLPPDGFDPVGNLLPNNGGGNPAPGNPPAPPAPPGAPAPPAPPANPPVNPQVTPFPWEEIVSDIPLYLALANGLGGGGQGGGVVNQSGPVTYQQAPVEAAPPFQPEPAAEATAAVDLILEDVRLAAPATLVAGPAYLVTLRNQSTIPVGRFHVAVMAGLNGSLTETAPQAVTEVALLQPGEGTSVLLRLPNTAMQMVAGEQVTPFTHLFVAADAMDGIVESDETNNTAILDRTALEGAGQ